MRAISLYRDSNAQPRRSLATALLILSLIAAIVLAFSLPILFDVITPFESIVVATLLFMAGIVMADRQDRRFWHLVWQERLAVMQQEYAQTEQELLATRAALLDLQNRLGKTETRLQGSPEARMLQQVVNRMVVRDSNDRLSSSDQNLLLLALRDALRTDRIEVLVQPIVTLPQRKQRHVEVMTRVRAPDGMALPARHYIALARQHGLVAALDNLALLRAVQVLRDARNPAGNASFYGATGQLCFCNIAPSTLEDAGFMRDLLGFLDDHPDLAQRLVLEVQQICWTTMTDESRRLFDGLMRLGCRFSIDAVTDWAILDPDDLAMRGVRFIKIDAADLLKAQLSGDEPVLRAFKDGLDRRAIDMVVNRIEHEKELVELLDLGVDYGQGYLFGAPAILEM